MIRDILLLLVEAIVTTFFGILVFHWIKKTLGKSLIRIATFLNKLIQSRPN